MSAHPTYALVGSRTGDFLTYGGRVIVHHSKDEMSFLFPRTRVVKVTSDPGPTIRLKDHPDLTHVQWPLRKEAFR